MTAVKSAMVSGGGSLTVAQAQRLAAAALNLAPSTGPSPMLTSSLQYGNNLVNTTGLSALQIQHKPSNAPLGKVTTMPPLSLTIVTPQPQSAGQTFLLQGEDHSQERTQSPSSAVS